MASLAYIHGFRTEELNPASPTPPLRPAPDGGWRDTHSSPDPASLSLQEHRLQWPRAAWPPQAVPRPFTSVPNPTDTGLPHFPTPTSNTSSPPHSWLMPLLLALLRKWKKLPETPTTSPLLVALSRSYGSDMRSGLEPPVLPPWPSGALLQGFSSTPANRSAFPSLLEAS